MQQVHGQPWQRQRLGRASQGPHTARNICLAPKRQSPNPCIRHGSSSRCISLGAAPSDLRQSGELYSGRWLVRPVKSGDAPACVELQAQAFFEASPLGPLMDRLTYKSFEAEVRDAVKQKIKLSDPEAFVMLVAEEAQPLSSAPRAEAAGAAARGDSFLPWGASSSDAADGRAEASGSQLSSGRASSSSSSSSSGAGLVGVVEVSLQSDKAVLSSLGMLSRAHGRAPPALYAYTASMAVAGPVRRQGLATALLQAAERQAVAWGQAELALYVYEDNEAAFRLYSKHGFQVVARDPGWKSMLGGRIRVLMHKDLSAEVAAAAAAAEEAAAAQPELHASHV